MTDPSVCVVTNDFPTRTGGIEVFVRRLCDAVDPDRLVVHTASMPGSAAYDRECPFEVVRDPGGTLLPTPAVVRRVRATLRRHDCRRVLFGAAAPLGLMAGPLRRTGVDRVAGLTHGHETWWATLPGSRSALRQIARECDILGYVSEWARDRIAAALGPEAAARLRRIAPGVDTSRFRPEAALGWRRQHLDRLGADGEHAPLVGVAGRLVRRKGVDTLIAAWPRIRARVPEAVLVVAGDGPDRARIAALAANRPDIVLLGDQPHDAMPGLLAALDVFVMPSRTRRAGLEPEALGIVALEAAACGTPVVVGDSGGAPETVAHGRTGWVVDPFNPVALAEKVIDLLCDADRRTAFGTAGRQRVGAGWSWPTAYAAVRSALDLPVAEREPS